MNVQRALKRLVKLHKTYSNVTESRAHPSHQLTTMRCTQYRDLVVTLDPRSGVRRIRIDVPRRKNAIRLDTYRHLAEALKEADEDPHTKITLLIG